MDVRSIGDEEARDKAPARAIRRLIGDRRAATAVEYGFILALVVIVTVAAIGGLGNTTSSMWNNINDKVTNAH